MWEVGRNGISCCDAAPQIVCMPREQLWGEDEMAGCWKYIESNCMNETCICRQIGFHNANYVTQSNLQKYRFTPPKNALKLFVLLTTQIRNVLGYDSAIGACVCAI